MKRPTFLLDKDGQIDKSYKTNDKSGLYTFEI
jgi:hypothetical protein